MNNNVRIILTGTLVISEKNIINTIESTEKANWINKEAKIIAYQIV